MIRLGIRSSILSVAVVALSLSFGAARAGEFGSPSDLPGWRDDDQAKALPALLKTCEWATGAGGAWLGGRKAAGRASDWRRVCGLARALPKGDTGAARRFFEGNFHTVTQAAREGTLSAYHAPVVAGSRDRDDRFDAPIHIVDEDDDGAAATIWVADSDIAGKMATEGSGHVRLADGTTLALDFAGRRSSDGRPFFSAREGSPRGSLGAELTPGRSLAVDPRHTPLGPPVWIDASDRSISMPGGGRRRLVVAQDTGGDVRGRGRVDLYVGRGASAERAANEDTSPVRLTLLVPRGPVGSPVQVAEGRSAKRKPGR